MIGKQFSRPYFVSYAKMPSIYTISIQNKTIFCLKKWILMIFWWFSVIFQEPDIWKIVVFPKENAIFYKIGIFKKKLKDYWLFVDRGPSQIFTLHSFQLLEASKVGPSEGITAGLKFWKSNFAQNITSNDILRLPEGQPTQCATFSIFDIFRKSFFSTF